MLESYLPRPFLQLKIIGASSSYLIRACKKTKNWPRWKRCPGRSPFTDRRWAGARRNFRRNCRSGRLWRATVNTKNTYVVLATSKEFLVHDALASTSVHIEDVVNELLLDSLNTRKKDVNNHLSAALERSVIRTIHKPVILPEYISQAPKAVIVNPSCHQGRSPLQGETTKKHD